MHTIWFHDLDVVTCDYVKLGARLTVGKQYKRNLNNRTALTKWYFIKFPHEFGRYIVQLSRIFRDYYNYIVDILDFTSVLVIFLFKQYIIIPIMLYISHQRKKTIFPFQSTFSIPEFLLEFIPASACV